MSPSESRNGREADSIPEGGILAALPRARPQRASARRAAARTSTAAKRSTAATKTATATKTKSARAATAKKQAARESPVVAEAVAAKKPKARKPVAAKKATSTGRRAAKKATSTGRRAAKPIAEPPSSLLPSRAMSPRRSSSSARASIHPAGPSWWSRWRTSLASSPTPGSPPAGVSSRTPSRCCAVPERSRPQEPSRRRRVLAESQVVAQNGREGSMYTCADAEFSRPRLRGTGDPMCEHQSRRSTGANRPESGRSAEVEREPVSSPRRRRAVHRYEPHACENNAARRRHRAPVRGRCQPYRTGRHGRRRRAGTPHLRQRRPHPARRRRSPPGSDRASTARRPRADRR